MENKKKRTTKKASNKKLKKTSSVPKYFDSSKILNLPTENKHAHTFFPSIFNNSMAVAQFVPENVPQLSYAMPDYNNPNLMSPTMDDNINKLFGNDDKKIPIEIGDFGNLDYDEHNIMIGGQNTYSPYMLSLFRHLLKQI